MIADVYPLLEQPALPALTASLAAKIDHGRGVLHQALDWFGPQAMAVAWTGGKDSTAALRLYLDCLAERGEKARAVALSLDTGRKFPEILAFRDELAMRWGVDLRLVKPEPQAIAQADVNDKLACCLALKVHPLRRAIAGMNLAALVSGIRADEHAGRKGRPVYEQRQDPAYLMINVLISWTLADVWAFTLDCGLPYCELYDQGYTSLGCMPCTEIPTPGAPERAGRASDKEAMLPVLQSLGYF